MPKTNFFIVGMQRAATTAMARYLGQHQEIVMCEPKEPHYFADDFPKIRKASCLDEYEKLFLSKTEARIYGEASTGYLFSRTAIENIYRYNPDAKIVVMLRNPVDMVHSLHAHLLFCGHEDEEDFSKAWKLQADRKKGERLSKDPRFHEFLNYFEVGLIGEQVDRLLSIFPRSQVKFILFDDFVKNPEGAYQEILRFLKLKSDERKNFERVNENMTYWLPFYYRLRKLIPWWVRSFIPKFYALIGKDNLKISRLIFASQKKSPRLTSTQRQMLINLYTSDIKKLSKLTELDLTRWLMI